MVVLGGYYGLPFALLLFCYLVSKDYRLRWRYSFYTKHLTLPELETAFDRNIDFLAVFLKDMRHSGVPAKRADQSLIMASVLQEHIAVLTGDPIPMSYLKRRKDLWKQAAARV